MHLSKEKVTWLRVFPAASLLLVELVDLTDTQRAEEDLKSRSGLGPRAAAGSASLWGTRTAWFPAPWTQHAGGITPVD